MNNLKSVFISATEFFPHIFLSVPVVFLFFVFLVQGETSQIMDRLRWNCVRIFTGQILQTLLILKHNHEFDIGGFEENVSKWVISWLHRHLCFPSGCSPTLVKLSFTKPLARPNSLYLVSEFKISTQFDPNLKSFSYCHNRHLLLIFWGNIISL